MNRYAYRTTGFALKALSSVMQPTVRIYDEENIPSDNSVIFVINHFTRAETLLAPYYINKITGRQIWSLADRGLFKGGLGSFLESVGALSTGNPDRDKLIVKTLLTNEASWIIFPEGRMVKNKKIYDVIDEKPRRWRCERNFIENAARRWRRYTRMRPNDCWKCTRSSLWML